MIAILGAGGWGTALAVHLVRTGHDAWLWGRDPSLVAELRSRRANAVYLPDITFPPGLQVTADLREALDWNRRHRRRRPVARACARCSGAPRLTSAPARSSSAPRRASSRIRCFARRRSSSRNLAIASGSACCRARASRRRWRASCRPRSASRRRTATWSSASRRTSARPTSASMAAATWSASRLAVR